MSWVLVKRCTCYWRYLRFPIHSVVLNLSVLVKGILPVHVGCLFLLAVFLLATSSYFAAKNGIIGENIKGLIRDTMHFSADTQQKGTKYYKSSTIDPLEYNYFKNYCHIVPPCRDVSCSSIPEKFDPGVVISIFIHNIFKVNCSSKSIINLILEKTKFSGNKLQESWLKTDVAIAGLILTNCFLTALSDEAFSSSIFREMTKLQLIDNNISTLSRATFHHLSRLEHLSIMNNEIKEAEKNLLQDVATNLENLELEQAISDTEVLRNITGGDDLWNVKVLALRSNRITIIDSRLFDGVSGIKSLYLERSSIKFVYADAFQPITESVEQIFINDNSIATLPKGLFDSIIQRNSTFLLSVHNNPWDCNCNLKWMQDMMIRYPLVIQRMPICRFPEENRDKSLANAKFCDQTTMPENAMNIPTSTINSTITNAINPTSQKTPKCSKPLCKDWPSMTIYVFVISLISMCLFSSILMYVVVRRHPAMLRGSKRIVVVKRGTLDVMVLPKGISSDTIESANKNTIPSISQNLKEDGYIVLLPPLQSSTRKNSRNSASSIESDGMSYISSIEPTLSQLNSWRLKRFEYTSRETEPPPLPPHPHPNIAQPLSTIMDVDEDDSDSCTV